MDSNDMGELLLMMILDDDLFFIEIDADEQEKNNVEKVSEQSDRQERG